MSVRRGAESLPLTLLKTSTMREVQERSWLASGVCSARALAARKVQGLPLSTPPPPASLPSLHWKEACREDLAGAWQKMGLHETAVALPSWLL